MKSLLAVPFILALSAAASSSAFAAKLPAIKTGAKNAVPECATPGRMWAFLKERNASIDPRYETIAVEYMRHGEELGIRWDFAFYQMIVETGALSYRNGSKPGDVKPSQNNFAGLGATGRGERGETFKDISSGVRAHLQHLLMYSGEKVVDPVAERTRKVQEWGVLDGWHNKLRSQGPITFTDLAQQWAPGSRGYASMLEDISEQFEEGFCSKPDPRPEMMQEARGKSAPSGASVAEVRSGAKQKVAKVEAPARDEIAEKITGAEIYRRKVEEERASGATRTGLGAGSIAAKETFVQPTTILNAPKSEPAEVATVQTAAAASTAAAIAKPAPTPPAAAPAKCQVFTASYGGQKAVIIKAVATDSVNYTVLDVNEGAEKRETDAFIQAYAKGGQMVGEFTSSNQALDKAFELCPEN